MHLIKANDIFLEARQLLEGRKIDGTPCERNLKRAEELLNEILNYNVGNEVVLYTLGSLHLSKGNHGLAIQLLSGVTQKAPKFGEAWNNLALSYRDALDFKRAVYCGLNAMKLLDHADIACNLSALFIGRDEAEDALKYANIALERDPKHEKSRWHKALALLELRRWDEAWDYHESRLHGGGNEDIALRNYHGPDGMTPEWDGQSPGTIVIHGEQGLGDEIMFASCIADALKVPGTKFICEPAPRLQSVFRRSFPSVQVFGTHHPDGRDWIERLGKPDYKIALGTLPKFFRRTPESFPGTPYLIPNPSKNTWWADKLASLGPRPNIGIAWQGGVQATRYDARSFHPTMLKPIFDAVDANWISLQYDDTAVDCVAQVKETLGVQIHHWPAAVSARGIITGKHDNDLDDLVSLVSELDLVVTVCQTSVHVAGALGIPTLVLTPSDPSWRYSAGSATDMPWYGSVRQIRQRKGEDWAVAINSAANILRGTMERITSADIA